MAEPHQFDVTLDMQHGDHSHRFAVRIGAPAAQRYRQQGSLSAAMRPAMTTGRQLSRQSQPESVYQDAHEKAHADEIARRFAGQPVSTGQIALFGLTGGLMPCPASVTILLLCLQLKRVALGATMVASFSLGLAISLVSVGVIAAWGARKAGPENRLAGWRGTTPALSVQPADGGDCAGHDGAGLAQLVV
jgi:nickel/cobalt exporter